MLGEGCSHIAFAPRPSTSKETREVCKLPNSFCFSRKITYDFVVDKKTYKLSRRAKIKKTAASGIAFTVSTSTKFKRTQWQAVVEVGIIRVGRITASKFHASSRASTNSPPRSLLEQLMGYKHVNSSAIPALDWGIKNEKTARMQYLERAAAQRDGLEYRPSGLHVNPLFPHLGASPDGLICCECCGEGTVEIKCPFKYRHCKPKDVQDPHFCLQPNSEGMSLSYSHGYYTQVQGQLAVCQRLFCDFVC